MLTCSSTRVLVLERLFLGRIIAAHWPHIRWYTVSAAKAGMANPQCMAPPLLVTYVLTFSYSTLQRLTTLFRCWGAWHGGAHPPAVAGRPCLAERTHLNRPRRRPPCPPTRLVQPRRLAQLARPPLPPRPSTSLLAWCGAGPTDAHLPVQLTRTAGTREIEVVVPCPDAPSVPSQSLPSLTTKWWCPRLDLFSIHCCAFSLFRTRRPRPFWAYVHGVSFCLDLPGSSSSARLLPLSPPVSAKRAGGYYSTATRDDGEQKEGQLQYSFFAVWRYDMRDKDMAACYCSLSRSCQPFFIPFKLQRFFFFLLDASSYLETRSLGGRQATGAGVATRWSRGSCPILLH